MAYQKKKEEEPVKGKKPDWSVRCRQSPDSDFYMAAGVAWNIVVNGKPGISMKLHALAINGDGSFLLLAPKDEE